ncbi:MAG TPA: cobalamin biosynthesis protein [Acetobacteraceae bacterium]|jgi:cobalt-precorrin 5A hydrolase|nr:cobalamin biosynthesis protein [Acetobacteraceae bacterium]
MIAAGVGCRRGCSADEIVAVVEQACIQAATRPVLLAAPETKADERGLRDAVARLGLTLHLVPDREIRAAQPRCTTFSARVAAHAGVGSIAEAAALAAAGAGSRVLLPRIATARATCALAVS